ncbi:hypothetical protein Tsubulata_037360 [Turnera subulata]|uniref:Late embryogenesis abundant protein LEA-2 subgroup domain-containing protein n=1 Tax=Turnera subulata TaxID=218843 RepID=A0A9Q0F719_9ROSI|nr:hypothetical protein Tsubulata_037360 [Turnera subulata]
MPEEDQGVQILAPAKSHPRSDEEYAPIKPKSSTPTSSSKCPVYLLAAIVLLTAIALVFSLVVLRPNTPDVELSQVIIEDLKYGNYSPNPSLNMTLSAEIRIKNSNFGKYEFENSTASVLYEDVVVGEAKLGQGSVSARKTERMSAVVDVRSQRLSDTKNLSRDISSGMLKLSSYARLSGKVLLIKKIKKQKTAIMNCTMTLNLRSRSVQELLCS